MKITNSTVDAKTPASKSSEELNQESASENARLDAILRISPDAIFTLHSDGNIVTVNTAAETMFGYTGEELSGVNISTLLPNLGDQKDNNDDWTTKLLDAKRVETVGQCKDNNQFPIEIVMGKYSENETTLFSLIVHDISELKKAKTSYLLKTSELQSVFEALPDCFFRLHSDGTILDYHTSELSRFYPATEFFLGSQLTDIFSIDIGKQYEHAIREVETTGKQVTLDYSITTESYPAQFEVRVMPFLHQQFIVIIRDVTSQRAKDHVLIDYHTLTGLLPVGIFRTDGKGNYVYVNERWCEIANVNLDQVEGHRWVQSIHPDDRGRIYDLWLQCVKKRQSFKAEFRFQHADGVVAWVFCQAVMEQNALGELTGYIGTITDITDRIKADEALRKAHIDLEMRVEERTADLRATNRWLQQMVTERKRAENALVEERNYISTVLETAGALVIVCNREGHIVQFNRSSEKTTGYLPAEVKDKIMWDIFLPSEQAIETKSIFQQLVNGTDRIEHEGELLTRKNEERHIAWSNTAIRDAEGQVSFVICTGIDITEQRKAEEEARQHQADLVHVSRLCTMGEMAAGLAHELNQPLAAIVSYTQGCVRRIASNNSDPSELLGAMKQVTLQAQRAGEIIKHLRSFVSKGELQRTTVQANTMVREVLSMAKIDVRRHQVTVRLRLIDNLPTLHVDMIQIEQVILNLVRNGMEAMNATDPEERELSMRTFLNDKGDVQFSTSDAGEGISDDLDPDKVFDAFFTTKKEGMGMGLAISRSIIEAHGGRLWAERNPDRGTTFHFTLPVNSQL